MRSKVAMLPGDVRTELERRIIERAFSGYQDLAEWLQAQGYHIAHDSVQRHGSRLAQKFEAVERLTDEAEAIAAAAHHGDSSLVDITIQLIHQRVLSILLEEPKRGDGSSSAGVPACAPYAEGGAGGVPSERLDSAGLSACPPSAELGQERSEEFNRANLSACTPLSDGGGGALALADLVRLTRIVADLSRITIARQRQATPPGTEPTFARGRRPPGEAGRERVGMRHAEGEGKGLSEETYQAIRNALLGINPFAEDPERSDGSSSAGVAACAPSSPESRGERNQGP